MFKFEINKSLICYKNEYMKKRFLLLSLLSSSLINAQSLTQANEPILGASTTMFVCDTSFSSYDEISGAGAVWDFSTISAQAENLSLTMSVKPSENKEFINSTKITEIAGFLSMYWNSTTDEKSSQGFVFTENSLGDIIINYSKNNEKLMSYPFSMVSTVLDTFIGTISNSSLQLKDVPCEGRITSTNDGVGTLKLPNNTTYSNVFRHKIVESTVGTVTIPNFEDILTKVNRTQYDYYAPENESALPVFSHITVKINAKGLNKIVTMVLSSVQPTTVASVSTLKEQKFSVYPNPTTDKIIIKGEFTENSSAKIVDQLGRVVKIIEVVKDGTEIDLSTIHAGIYILTVSQNGTETQERISVK